MNNALKRPFFRRATALQDYLDSLDKAPLLKASAKSRRETILRLSEAAYRGAGALAVAEFAEDINLYSAWGCRPRNARPCKKRRARRTNLWLM
jgi:hypothetical protein